MAKKPLAQDLQFEKKNQDMLKLPKHARIQKRPIPHAAIASPYAGPSVPKTVYVSTKTPFMSVIKRVQKLLRQAEKRATASVNLSNGKKSEKQKFAQLVRGQEELVKEEVFVKATGRAMDKVLSVGKWFEERGDEFVVRVKTGSVLVVDDILEDEGVKKAEAEKVQAEEEEKQEDKDTTAESGLSKSAIKKRKRAARAVAEAEESELPETRTRWVNMVEVAVALK
ncbi:hypothetical protein ASPWEDRAFT_24906 [Aspergillus wentii DTO 134E9]|uniref:Uncharacterized protein n=1 Tax=Aspergillus wentii DTO 134E9 TaxID=1073089 RepID=A0A1L9RVU5_ASPWE|nr:uncharacterized protein ASPWEDRAFT_24906 [Aspergillus wentii DTO 134E9]KAI9929254.1 hypothetical protein MW887_001662 [Aspergillus wentii]OJJ39042.1 hypothetical protein ASPWEDRAFT_24906 [Aspergillus wentii DTO 134E9]